jgi:HopA1 effector protein family
VSTAGLPEWVSADLTRALQVARWHPDAAAEELASILYSEWYAPAERVDLADGGRPPLFGQYRAAHAGSNSFVEAEVAGLAPGGILLAAAALERPRALLPGDYCHPSGSDRAGLPPRIGERVLIVQRQDAPPADGWWRTWGRGWRPADPPSTLSRIYLAADPDRVLELIGRLTGLLLERTEPWLLKAPADRAALVRPDAVVVYLPSAELGSQPGSDAVITGLASCGAGLVRDARPALTLGLAPGVALAEDPIGEQSFGEWVSGLVAGALVSVRRDDAAGSLAGMVAELSAAGLDPARPYVRPEVRP